MNHWIYFAIGIILGVYIAPWIYLLHRKIKFIIHMRKAMKELGCYSETREEAMKKIGEWRND